MWIEEAAASLDVSLADYAAGGATTGSVPGREQRQTILQLALHSILAGTEQYSKMYLTVIMTPVCLSLHCKARSFWCTPQPESA